MSGLWTGTELADVLGPPSAPLAGVDGVSIDTRTLASTMKLLRWLAARNINVG